ncbi:2-C-methyl-D-erythritol 2,4-cyclodiphosphate synthase [Oscillospiraceae bacterium OttesenSCG-928-F05]|nr:2-C-methyl-D-erythritol 2,4-cyclodiphosphate synthase [Oscillospiraceae bacterium OttesenSCG-928-F05]
MRIGHGYDVHRFAIGRPFILGGVDIPHTQGLLGHSDADVLTHAIMDALLGAMALGDIGVHFPDTDEKYKGASSIALLERVGDMLRERRHSVENIDSTVLCERPKLRPYIPAMTERIAAALRIPASAVNIKATTEEGLGFTGKGEGVAAHAVCLIK